MTTDITSVSYAGGNTMFDAKKDIGSVSQQDFLTLLITQMKYQDPMEPQDSQQFAAQLAQFTSLEELQKLNSTSTQGVETNLMLAQTINNTMAATMVGKEVKAIGNSLELAHGVNPTLSFETGAWAANVEISIKDASGHVVDNISEVSLAKGIHELEWDGIGNNGGRLPPGDYTFEVVATDGGGNSVASDTVMVGIIDAVRYTSTGAIFMVNGKEIPFSSVLELGQPTTVDSTEAESETESDTDTESDPEKESEA